MPAASKISTGVGTATPEDSSRPTARLAHFAIFNPTISPPAHDDKKDSKQCAPPVLSPWQGGSGDPHQERDRDGQGPSTGDAVSEPEVDRDDLEQAAQIVFYACPDHEDVPRDVILRQVGLVRGLMAFTSAVAPGQEPWWSVHSNNARMVVYIADGYHFYANIRDAKGWSDRMVADLLERGYEDFCLSHGRLPLTPSSADLVNLSALYGRFVQELDTVHLATLPSNRFPLWIGHVQTTPLTDDAVKGAIDVLIEDISDGSVDNESVRGGLITPTQTYHCPDRALERFLRPHLIASLPPPAPPLARRLPGRRKEEDTRKVSLGSWAWPFGTRPSTPADKVDKGGSGDIKRDSSMDGRAGGSGSGRTGMDTTRAGDTIESTGPPRPAQVESGKTSATGTRSGEEVKASAAWLGLGSVPSAIGGAVGSMGTMFGLRSSSTSEPAGNRTIRADQLFPEAASTNAGATPKPEDRAATGVEAVSAGESPAGRAKEQAGQQTSPVADIKQDGADVRAAVARDTEDAGVPVPDDALVPELEDGRADDAAVDDSSERRSIRSVLEPVVPLSELADAQSDQQALSPPLKWEERVLWLTEYAEKRRVAWVTRDSMLFFLVLPQTSYSPTEDGVGHVGEEDRIMDPSSPPSSAPASARPPAPDAVVLSLFNKLAGILAPESPQAASAPSSTSGRHARNKSAHAHTGDTALVESPTGGNRLLGSGQADEASAPVFADLRDTLLKHPHIEEIFTRTSAPAPAKAAAGATAAPGGSGKRDGAQSMFVGAKRSEAGDEVYLTVGKPEASLVDADNSMRVVLRSLAANG